MYCTYLFSIFLLFLIIFNICDKLLFFKKSPIIEGLTNNDTHIMKNKSKLLSIVHYLQHNENTLKEILNKDIPKISINKDSDSDAVEELKKKINNTIKLCNKTIIGINKLYKNSKPTAFRLLKCDNKDNTSCNKKKYAPPSKDTIIPHMCLAKSCKSTNENKELCAAYNKYFECLKDVTGEIKKFCLCSSISINNKTSSK